jgi:dolichol-phosphate mannosyltransferase
LQISGLATIRPGLAADETTRPAPELAIVVPTFKERENVSELISRLRKLLAHCDWEVLFVDDNSPDGTAALLRQIGESDQRIRCIRRIGRRGLAGACLEGMLATQARFVAVMDADLQHDENLLLPMLQRLRDGDLELVVASRYLDEGSAHALGQTRARLSLLANRLARTVTGVNLSDPMSGYFMIRRTALEDVASSLRSDGFKILFDIVATAHGRLRIAELPMVFRARFLGESKLDLRVAVDYAALVASKLTGDRISFRFLLFCFVGLTGVGIHMAILQATIAYAALQFEVAQTVATIGAIAWNFTLNNMLTYRDQRLSGWGFLTGLLRFQIICGIGAISNVGIASMMYGYNTGWWFAGLTGALMGAVWNYMASAVWVWRMR